MAKTPVTLSTNETHTFNTKGERNFSVQVTSGTVALQWDLNDGNGFVNITDASWTSDATGIIDIVANVEYKLTGSGTIGFIS